MLADPAVPAPITTELKETPEMDLAVKEVEAILRDGLTLTRVARALDVLSKKGRSLERALAQSRERLAWIHKFAEEHCGYSPTDSVRSPEQAIADALEKEREGMVMMPREVDRTKHGNVLLVWNDCMINHETLEMTWPKLIEAFTASEPEGSGG